MKILFVAPYVPNQIRVRPYQLIHTLVNRGHAVTLLAVQSSMQEQEDLDSLGDAGVEAYAYSLPTWRSAGNCAQAMVTNRPLQATYSWHTALSEKLQQLVTDGAYDVVHIEHLRGAQYGVHLQNTALRVNGTSNTEQTARIPIVWDSVDCISHLFEQAAQESRSLKGRLMTRLELNRTRKYEGYLVHRFDRVLVTSPADKAALIRLAEDQSESANRTDESNSRQSLDGKVHVLPNGVDLDYFTVGNGTRSASHIVFSGKMSYHANITAALYLVQDIMPLVWAVRPDAEVCIVGKDPSAEVRALATDSPSESTPTHDKRNHVVVTGTVPDIRHYLRGAAIAVAPMPYGAGIQNKVLEAMACGAPVVASPQAVSALSMTPGRDALVADSAEAIAQAILQLLDRPEQREALSHAGRAYVERCHSWDEIGAQLEEIYASVTDKRVYT